MVNRREISQEQVKSLFNYRGGFLYWKYRVNSKVPAGTKAGSPHSNGYICIRIKGQLHYAHRLIFLYFKGFLPKYVDHINNIRDDNKIENLRECEHSQNHANRKKAGGISYRKKENKYTARIGVKSRQIWIGSFDTEIEAKRAYNERAKKEFGEFANSHDV